MQNLSLLLYVTPLLLILAIYIKRNRKINRRGRERLREAKEAGLNEPASIHPIIDPGRCVGSGACVKACPEKALSMVMAKRCSPMHRIASAMALAWRHAQSKQSNWYLAQKNAAWTFRW
jgi:formate hydrogenlyase subunit 6/NADH:ubiquinone oxidoreductase subunit I